MSKRLLGALAALAIAAPAVSVAETMDYSYAEIDYLDTELDDVDIDGNGFGLKGSIAIQQTFFAFAEYQDLDLDVDGGVDVDGSLLLVGGGAHWPLGDKLDLVGRVGFARAEFEVSDGGFSADVDEDGFLAGARLRGTPLAKLELEGGLEYRDLDEFGDDTLLIGEARYFFLDNLSGGVQVEIGEDQTTYGVGVRLTF